MRARRAQLLALLHSAPPLAAPFSLRARRYHSRVEVYRHGGGLAAHSRHFIVEPAILPALVVSQRVGHRAVDGAREACRWGRRCKVWRLVDASLDGNQPFACQLASLYGTEAGTLQYSASGNQSQPSVFLTHLSIGALVLQADPGAVSLLPLVHNRELPPIPANLAVAR